MDFAIALSILRNGAASHRRYLPLAGNRTLMLSTRFACLSGIRLLDCKSDPIMQSVASRFWQPVMISHWIAATALILLVAGGMAIAWQFRKKAKLAGADISGPGEWIDGSHHGSDGDV
jgi:hypothetical protein